MRFVIVDRLRAPRESRWCNNLTTIFLRFMTIIHHDRLKNRLDCLRLLVKINFYVDTHFESIRRDFLWQSLFLYSQHRGQEVLRHQPVAEREDAAAHLVEWVVPFARGDRGLGGWSAGMTQNQMLKLLIWFDFGKESVWIFVQLIFGARWHKKQLNKKPKHCLTWDFLSPLYIKAILVLLTGLILAL